MEPVDNEAKVRQKVHGMVVSMVASVGGGADVVAAALGRRFLLALDRARCFPYAKD